MLKLALALALATRKDGVRGPNQPTSARIGTAGNPLHANRPVWEDHEPTSVYYKWIMHLRRLYGLYEPTGDFEKLQARLVLQSR